MSYPTKMAYCYPKNTKNAMGWHDGMRLKLCKWWCAWKHDWKKKPPRIERITMTTVPSLVHMVSQHSHCPTTETSAQPARPRHSKEFTRFRLVLWIFHPETAFKSVQIISNHSTKTNQKKLILPYPSTKNPSRIRIQKAEVSEDDGCPPQIPPH